MEENLHYFEALGKKLIYDPQTLFCFGLPDSEYKHLNDNMTREELNKRLSAAQANMSGNSFTAIHVTHQNFPLALEIRIMDLLLRVHIYILTQSPLPLTM